MPNHIIRNFDENRIIAYSIIFRAVTIPGGIDCEICNRLSCASNGFEILDDCHVYLCCDGCWDCLDFLSTLTPDIDERICK
jgi:hypothetical protein